MTMKENRPIRLVLAPVAAAALMACSASGSLDTSASGAGPHARDFRSYGAVSPQVVVSPDGTVGGGMRRGADFAARQRDLMRQAVAEARRNRQTLATTQDQEGRARRMAAEDQAAARAERQIMLERQGLTVAPERHLRVPDEPLARQRFLAREAADLRRNNVIERQRRAAAADIASGAAPSQRTLDDAADLQRRGVEALTTRPPPLPNASPAGVPRAAQDVFIPTE